MADPRRIVQVRAQLHTGQQIQYLSWNDGKLRSARVVGMHGDHVAIHDAAYNKAFKVHYSAILSKPTGASTENSPTSADVELTKPTPPPEVASRAEFRVGNQVTFTDKNLQHRVGVIVRVNQHTATLDCDGQSGESPSVCFGISSTSDLSGRQQGSRRTITAYPLSVRNLEEVMAQRGVLVDHATVHRWQRKRLPVLAKVFRRRQHHVGRAWRVDRRA